MGKHIYMQTHDPITRSIAIDVRLLELPWPVEVHAVCLSRHDSAR